MNDFTAKALPLLLQGIPVFPCGPDKAPLIENGFKAATTDLEQVEQWNLLNPQALVGVPTGEASKLFVLDVDADVELPGALPVTQTHTTRRGKHYVMRLNGTALRSTAGAIAEKVDTRAAGGYIVWWPAEGLAVENEGTLADVPAWIAERLAKGQETASAGIVESHLTLATVGPMLAVLDPDMKRNDWRNIGMAVKKQLGESGWPAWHGWSATAKTAGMYPGENECRKQWESFRNDKAGGITAGTLVGMATAAGWTPPPADVSGMFEPTVVKFSPLETLEQSAVPYPVLDTSILPEVLRNAAEAVSNSTGCAPLVPIAAGLVAACTAVDKQSTMEVKQGMTVRPILCMMPIGTPADGKTPGSKPMFTTFAELEKEHRPLHEAAMLGWIGKEARHAAQTKAYREWSQSPESEVPNTTGPKVEDLEPPPVRLRLVTNNVSTAKVLALLSDRPRGITYILQDGTKWLNDLANPNSYNDSTVWLQTAEGGPYYVDRVGGGELYLPNAAVPMLVNTHPDVLYKLRHKLAGDGNMQRFMPVPLDTTKTHEGGEEPRYDEAMKAWDAMLRTLFAAPVTRYELSAEAKVVWQEFKAYTTKLKKDLQTVSHSLYLTGYAGKMEGFAANVALVFHIIDHPYGTTVDAGVMLRAIEFVKFTFRCAAFVDNACISGDSFEVKVSEVVLVASGAKDVLSMHDILRSMKRHIEDMPPYTAREMVRTSMDVLSSKGWCSLYQDHPRFPVWTINPNLNEQMRERREKILQIRQELRDKIAGK